MKLGFLRLFMLLLVVHQSFSMDELLEAYASGNEDFDDEKMLAAREVMPVMYIYIGGEILPLITAEIRLTNQEGADMLLDRYLVFYNERYQSRLNLQRASRQRRFEEMEDGAGEESILV